jgi:hypothetical protein
MQKVTKNVTLTPRSGLQPQLRGDVGRGGHRYPQLPTAVEMRAIAEKHGSIRYVITGTTSTTSSATTTQGR